MNRYDPMNAAALRDPSFAEAYDLLDHTIGPDVEWTRDNLAAGLARMDACPRHSTAQRAVTVIEKQLKGQPDPLGAIEAMGRPVDDGELLGIVNVR
jgi:hypothetical protein